MRLLSLSIRNYRVHRECDITFDPSLTLLGGPNESGKSTLVEAAHRALFLRSRAGGRVLENMRSHHGGHPEVVVAFEISGAPYRVEKRFRGPAGTTVLHTPDGRAVHGAEAEDTLAALLGGQAAGAQEAILRAQWGHLWVWQGSSREAVSEFGQSQGESMLAQLQREAGGSVLVSARDQAMAAYFARMTSSIFRENGQPRVDSELGKARQAETDAKSRLEAARTTMERLADAMRRHETATTTLADLTPTIIALREEHEAAAARVARDTSLGQSEVHLAGEEQKAAATVAGLAEIETRIAGHRAAMARLDQELSPWQARESELEQRVAAAEAQLAAATEALTAAESAESAARSRADLAQAALTLLECARKLDGLRDRGTRVAAARENRHQAESDLAALPIIRPEDIHVLQDLMVASQTASARWRGMATAIEVVAGDGVRADGAELPPGRRLVVTEPTDIHLGEDVHLRVVPGDGQGLSAARQAADTAAAQLAGKLQSLGVADIESAREVAAKRAALQTRLDQSVRDLSLLGAETLDSELARATGEESLARQRHQDLLADNPEAPAPRDPEDATSRLAEARQAMVARSTGTAAARVAATEARHRRDTEAAELAAHRTQGQQMLQARHDASHLLAHEIEVHGNDAARAEAMTLAREAHAAATARLESARAERNSLDAGEARTTMERLQKAIDGAQQGIHTAHLEIAATRAVLDQCGVHNPEEDFLEAAARHDQAARALQAADVRARAMARLDALFRSEQEALDHRVALPFASRMESYLRFVFGPDIQVRVEMDGASIDRLSFRRAIDGGQEMDFAALSEGAREQIGVAARLAMAETLAAAGDGTLPLVLDDAFAASDPERVRALHGMLFHASRSGLQIIVVSCSPGDYTALGAGKTILLPPR